MANTVKITALTDIGANMSYTVLLPVVNMAGTPLTEKANVQNLGNYILSQAGGANLVAAGVANISYTVANAAQPNITSFGTLTGLVSAGTINFISASNVSLGSVNNLKITGGTNGQILSTDGAGNLSWVSDTDTNYSNSNVASYLPTYTGNLSAGNANLGNTVTANYFVGNGSFLTDVTNYTNANAVSYAETGWAGNIIPAANAVYSLGSLAKQWSELWVSNNTIYIGGVPLGVTEGNVLTVGGQPLLSNDSNTSISTTGNITADIITANNIGNVAALNLDGNASNVLYGTGAFAPLPAGYSNSDATSLLASFGSNTISTTGNVDVGNISAINGIFSNISGNGAALSSITGANVMGAVANSIYADSAGSAITAGTVTTASQPNVTSVGTLSNLSVSGNANIGNIGTGKIVLINNAVIKDTAGSAVAFGVQSGQTNQGNDAVAIGTSAGNDSQGTGAVAVGHLAAISSQAPQAVSVGFGAGNEGQGQQAVAIGSLAGQTNQGFSAVAIGGGAGGVNQSPAAIAIGGDAGSNAQGTWAVAIGRLAGNNSQKANAIAIGSDAGSDNQGSLSIAIGRNAGGTNQANESIAMGNGAGYTNQGANAVAIGGGAGYDTQGANAIAIGHNTGLTNQGEQSIGIGFSAGNDNQGVQALAIGLVAGSSNQGAYAVAVGGSAGYSNQGINAIAVGSLSGRNTQGTQAIAIGTFAGYENQGANSIAIGTKAGPNNQHAHTIILNASGYNLQSTGVSSFYVDPIRNDAANITNAVFYDTTSKEVTYGAIGNIISTNLDGNVSNVLYGDGTFAAPGVPTAVAAMGETNSTLSDKTSTINTVGKVTGKLVVTSGETPGNRLIYAAEGPNPTDTWISVSGNTDITPV